MSIRGGVFTHMTATGVSFVQIFKLRVMPTESLIRVSTERVKQDKHTGKYQKGNLFLELFPKDWVPWYLRVKSTEEMVAGQIRQIVTESSHHRISYHELSRGY